MQFLACIDAGFTAKKLGYKFGEKMCQNFKEYRSAMITLRIMVQTMELTHLLSQMASSSGDETSTHGNQADQEQET